MKKKIIYIAVALILFVGAFLIANRTHHDATVEQKVTIDSIEVASQFFNAWLEARQSTSTNPFDQNVAASEHITDDVRNYINGARDTYTEKDPVLCLTQVPPRIGVRPVYEATTTAEVMVVPRKLETPVPQSAIVKLELIDKNWKIVNITCSNGEEAPVSEFSFERAGFATKTLPAPYASDTWHIVFTQDDGRIGATPLLFDGESLCAAADGTESYCTSDKLVEGGRIYIKSNLTETGALIKHLKIVSN